MPHLPASARLWKERAELDYIGPFVKAWAAFNAWFRVDSGSHRDAEGLKYVKEHANPVRSAIKPLLRPRELDENGRPRPDSEDATQFKLLVRDLHATLDSYHIEVLRDDVLERISFRSVCLTNGVNLPKQRAYNRHRYSVTKERGVWKSTVTRIAATTVQANIEQTTYDITGLQDAPEFGTLTLTQRAQLLSLYNECNPRPLTDLISGTNPPISAGDIEFRCTDDQLFCGLIEVIYAMRNALLHGELQPDEQALKAYEAAYRIIMRFLDCIPG